MMYRLSDATSTAETVVPSASAFACAASHTSSGTRRVRILVSANGLHTRLLTRSGSRHSVRVVREVDQTVTALRGLGQHDQRNGDGGLTALAELAVAGDLHTGIVYTAVYTCQGESDRNGKAVIAHLDAA